MQVVLTYIGKNNLIEKKTINMQIVQKRSGTKEDVNTNENKEHRKN